MSPIMTRSRRKKKNVPPENVSDDVESDGSKQNVAKKAEATKSRKSSSAGASRYKKKQKTEAATSLPVPPQSIQALYNVESTIIGSQEWGAGAYNNEPNWAFHFPVFGKKATFMSPRMAATLFHESFIVGDEFNFGFDSRLCQIPDIARSCFRHSNTFRLNFVACIERILRQLQKGLLPFPNCVGEMLALDLIIQSAKEESQLNDTSDYALLPVTALDTSFDMVCNGLMPTPRDQLVLQILAEASEDSDFSDCEYDTDCRPRFSWSNVGPSPLQDSEEAMLSYAQNKVMYFPMEACVGKLTLLHPGKWFVAFSEIDMENHL